MVYVSRKEWLGSAAGRNSLHLISNQPADKLHSQLDNVSDKSRREIQRPRTPAHSPRGCRSLRDNRRAIAFVFTIGAERFWPPPFLIAASCVGLFKSCTGAWLDALPQADGTLLCRHGQPEYRHKGATARR